MKKFLLASISILFSSVVFAQDSTAIIGHKNNNKFKQLYEEFATPNRFRTASELLELITINSKWIIKWTSN